MSMDIIADTDGERLNRNFRHYTWSLLLQIAQAYGWRPAGTVRYDDGEIDEDWSGGYSSNDFQYVRPQDARNLAAALARSVDDNLALLEQVQEELRDDLRRQFIREEADRQRIEGLLSTLWAPIGSAHMVMIVEDMRATAQSGGFYLC